MKQKRFSEKLIAFALRKVECGTRIEEICRKMRISESVLYRWKKVYAGMGVADIQRLKQLGDENAKLKRVVASLPLEKAMLQDVLQRNGETHRSSQDRASSSESLLYRRTTGLQRTRLPSIFAAL